MKLVLVFILLLSSITFGVQQTSVVCQSNVTALLIYNLTVCSSGECEEVAAIETIVCPYGCDNSTGGSNDCNVNPDENILNTIPSLLFIGLLVMAIGFSVVTVFAKQFWLRASFLFGGLITLISASNILLEASSIYRMTTYGQALIGYYEFAVYFSFFIFAIFVAYFLWDLLDLFGKLPQWAVRFKERKNELESEE